MSRERERERLNGKSCGTVSGETTDEDGGGRSGYEKNSKTSTYSATCNGGHPAGKEELSHFRQQNDKLSKWEGKETCTPEGGRKARSVATATPLLQICLGRDATTTFPFCCPATG
jgi:hypothetical protein